MNQQDTERATTTTKQVTKAFHYSDKTNRIVAYGRNAQVVLPRPRNSATSIAVGANLLGPETKIENGLTLFLQLQPQDATALAESILGAAKELGWKLPPGLYQFVTQDVGHDIPKN